MTVAVGTLRLEDITAEQLAEFKEYMPDGVTRQQFKFYKLAASYAPKWSCTSGRPMLHFVRFKDDRYNNAVRVFGKPDFVHRFWDHRAVAEVMPGDMVVFAEGDETQDVVAFSYDDSAFF